MILRDFERRMASEFQRYFEMACAGEARHATSLTETNYCPTCDGEGHEYCGHCYTEGGAYVCDGSCDDPDCEGCEWESCEVCDGAGQIDCDDCEGTGEREENLFDASTVGDGVRELIARAGGRNRSIAFLEYLNLRESYGSKLIRETYHLFNDNPWPSGYGGKAWASIARLTADYVEGKINARVFINMAWSQQHNGGCAFNKVYETDNLQLVLDEQAYGSYERMIRRWASPQVKDLWEWKRQIDRAEYDSVWLGR